MHRRSKSLPKSEQHLLVADCIYKKNQGKSRAAFPPALPPGDDCDCPQVDVALVDICHYFPTNVQAENCLFSEHFPGLQYQIEMAGRPNILTE